MFAVIFEVQPRKECWDDYLSLAKFLKPALEKIDGFIDNERFASKRTKGRVLSLSTWRDEKAIIRWRTLGMHHEVQEKGRFEVFEDYRLRVGEITADTQIPKGQKLLQQRFDETEVSQAKVVTISELSPTDGKKSASTDLVTDLGAPETGVHGVIDCEVFESIYNPGKLLLLVSWQDADAAEARKPKATATGKLRRRQVRVIRDYGMFDRREAPQYYPDIGSKPIRVTGKLGSG
jgi:heme-degrading monooxygenase HmoA